MTVDRGVPSRADVCEKLRQLIAGEATREQVSLWAHRWVAAGRSEVDDQAVWTALTWLGGADLRAGAEEYLYLGLDFEAWIDEVEGACDTPE